MGGSAQGGKGKRAKEEREVGEGGREERVNWHLYQVVLIGPSAVLGALLGWLYEVHPHCAGWIFFTWPMNSSVNLSQEHFP